MADLQRGDEQIIGVSDDVPGYMRVESNTINPVISTQNFARFVLQPQGILSRDSCLRFITHVSTDADSKAWYPISVGVHTLISNSVLKFDGKVISSLDTGVAPYWAHIQHSYQDPDYRYGVSQHLQGINTVVCPSTCVAGGRGTFTLKSQIPLSPTSASIPYTLRLRDKAHADEAPEHMISLKTLFPILASYEPDLGLLKGEITIDLTFNQQNASTAGGDVLK